MAEPPYTKAPRWREGLAGLVDVAIVGGVAWLAARGEAPAQAAARLRWLRLVPADAVREQLRTPGQRLLGIRTVDRRTGERVALWRTLALVGVAAGGQQLARRVAPQAQSEERERDRDSYLQELREIHMRHPLDSPERQAAMSELMRRHGPMRANLLATVGPMAGVALLTSRLRRRMAPTVEVLVRGR